MPQSLAPDVRLQFARRLKDMRTRRGFDRARYFAKSLGIEENRYTRYERAEVEPSLTLIQKMCKTLQVSPNELLGFAEAPLQRPFEGAPGLAEAPAVDVANANGADAVSALAWSLATEAVAIRHERTGRSKAASGDLMRDLEETSALFGRLRSDPFRAVAEIVGDRALKGADAARRTKLAELIQAYTESVSEPAGRQRR